MAYPVSSLTSRSFPYVLESYYYTVLIKLGKPMEVRGPLLFSVKPAVCT